MGSALTKENEKISSGQPTTNYTGHQSNSTFGRSLTLQPRRRKPFRHKKRPTSVDGSTGVYDNNDPLRRRYLEKDLDLYYELQNHVENARQRIRDKGRNEIVSGGLSTSLVTGQEKCYDPNDNTLTFVDGEDDMDFECNDYKSLRARMSCGHSVTPMSLTNWCRRLLDQGESRFVCGQTDCNAEWSYEEVCKMALLTPEEIEYFEKNMFSRAAKDYLSVKECPGCKSSVVRTDLSNLRVLCTVCTADRQKTFEFCWQCLDEWKGPSQYPDRCANDGCVNKSLEVLKACPNITFKDVKGVTGCPSTRACPTCALLVEHTGTRCKNICCPRCKVQFCFVCLKLSAECGSYFTACSTGVAPRQTSVPVWKK